MSSCCCCCFDPGCCRCDPTTNPYETRLLHPATLWAAASRGTTREEPIRQGRSIPLSTIQQYLHGCNNHYFVSWMYCFIQEATKNLIILFYFLFLGPIQFVVIFLIFCTFSVCNFFFLTICLEFFFF